MEPALTGSVDKLLERGLSGIVMLALAFALWRVWKLYVEVQEKRVTEAVASTKALETNAAVIENMTKVIERLVNTRQSQ